MSAKGIFYGSSTGNTEELANSIAGKLGVSSSDVHDVSKGSIEKVNSYEVLLLGSSTWGLGDLQDDWYDFINDLKKENLSGKKVGLFGCGDSSSYPDTFCDAIGVLKEELEPTGCTFIGAGFADDYTETDSKAFEGGSPIGLVIDDDNPGQTEEHLEKWVEAIKNS